MSSARAIVACPASGRPAGALALALLSLRLLP